MAISVGWCCKEGDEECPGLARTGAKYKVQRYILSLRSQKTDLKCSAGNDKKLKNLMNSLAFKLAGIPNRDGNPHPPTADLLQFYMHRKLINGALRGHLDSGCIFVRHLTPIYACRGSSTSSSPFFRVRTQNHGMVRPIAPEEHKREIRLDKHVRCGPSRW